MLFKGSPPDMRAYSPGAYDDRIAEIDRELDAARRSLAKIDTELRSLREDETHPAQLGERRLPRHCLELLRSGSPTERERFGWLQVPRDATDDPPVTEADLVAWLRICRIYDDDRHYQLQASGGPESQKLPSSSGIWQRREQPSGKPRRLSSDSPNCGTMRLIGRIVALATDERAELAEATAEAGGSAHRLDRSRARLASPMLSQALWEVGKLLWQALLDRSRELIGEIDSITRVVWVPLRYVIPADKESKAVRADAVAVIRHPASRWRVDQLGILHTEGCEGAASTSVTESR